jgi:hypothetical protein
MRHRDEVYYNPGNLEAILLPGQSGMVGIHHSSPRSVATYTGQRKWTGGS